MWIVPSALAVCDVKSISWAEADDFGCGFHLDAPFLCEYRSQDYSMYPYYVRKTTSALDQTSVWCPNLVSNALRNPVPREMLSPRGNYLMWSTSIGLGGHLRSPDAVAVCQSAD